MKIAVVVIHHNQPEKADSLFEKLVEGFEDVFLFDSGSEPELMPIHITHTFDNIYWTGLWNEAISLFGKSHDVVWVLGADIELRNEAKEYKEAIETAMPFGCWSPVVKGRAHDFMKGNKGEKFEVKNIEGMALAISKSLIDKIGGELLGGTNGYGQDFWLCYISRKNELRNILDGCVEVYHPPGTGYSDSEAHDQMETFFSEKFGKDFRQTIFEYSSSFDGNLWKEKEMSKKKVITLDKHGNIGEFVFIMSQLEDVKGVVLTKRPNMPNRIGGVEIKEWNDQTYEEELLSADVALFPNIEGLTEENVFSVMSQVPVVMRVEFSKPFVDHEVDGFIYQHSSWAVSWIKDILSDELLATRVKEAAKIKIASQENTEDGEKLKIENGENPKITVITPTFCRDMEIVNRCIGSVRVQTEKNWEHIICSDGEKESQVADLVSSYGDDRLKYFYTDSRKEGDYGNNVRNEMLKKARGEYVVFLDDDNLIIPEYFEVMLGALTEGDGQFAICRCLHFGPLQPIVGNPPVRLTGIPPQLHYIDTLQVMARREDLLAIGGWDQKAGYFADGITFEKLAENYKYVEVKQTLAIHL